MEEIGELTDRQIAMIHCHPRDQKGLLKPPPLLKVCKKKLSKQERPPETMEEEIASVKALEGLLGQQGLEKAIEDIKSRWVDGKRIYKDGRQDG